MKSTLDCLPCNLSLILRMLASSDLPDEQQRAVVNAVLADLRAMDLSRPPADNMTEILLRATEAMGSPDPYAAARDQANQVALDLMPSLRAHLDQAQDRLTMAIRISLAGNIMDLAPQGSYDLEASIESALSSPICEDALGRLRARLRPESKVVVLGDNSGEVVFDRLLLEELRSHVTDLTYVVRGGPILNDCTRADARVAGIEQVARVETTGAASLGIPGDAEPLLTTLRASDLVIAKGMANYETLTEIDLGQTTVAYVLRAKCGPVADSLGVRLGDPVFRVGLQGASI